MASPTPTPTPQAEPTRPAPDRAARLRRTLRSWGPQLLFLVVVFLGLRAYQLRGAAEGEAPPVVGRSVHAPDQWLTLAQHRGQPTLVYFWATWCGVCNVVDPNVDAVAADHPVLTVAVSSGGEEEVAGWMRERGLSMPTVTDPEGRIARSFGVRAFPTSFFVDAEGQITAREVGYTSTLGLRGRLWLAR
ncbi:MAG: protein disulfide oxidoreductase [Polyangiales bacterium]